MKRCWCGREVRHDGLFYKHLCEECIWKYVYKIPEALPLPEPVRARRWLIGFYVWLSELGGIDPERLPRGCE